MLRKIIMKHGYVYITYTIIIYSYSKFKILKDFLPKYNALKLCTLWSSKIYCFLWQSICATLAPFRISQAHGQTDYYEGNKLTFVVRVSECTLHSSESAHRLKHPMEIWQQSQIPTFNFKNAHKHTCIPHIHMSIEHMCLCMRLFWLWSQLKLNVKLMWFWSWK